MKLVLFSFSFSICIAAGVDHINIVGNKHTQNYIIYREIHHPIPGEFDTTIMIQDRNRIYNLGLFSTVEINQIDSSYTVILEETLRFLPIPIVEYNEAKGFSYGGSITYSNFRGMNEKLSMGVISGKETRYFLHYNNPWIWGDHVSLKGKLYQHHIYNRVYESHYQENGFYIETGFYKNKYHKFKLSIGLEIIKLDSLSTNFTKMEYEFLKSKLTYHYDTRDIYIDPTNGQHFSISIFPKYEIRNPDLSYYRIFVHNTWYFLISERLNNLVLSLKSAVLLQHSQSFPSFADVYLGGDDFVRGYSHIPNENESVEEGVLKGYNLLYQTVQMQHTLFDRVDYGYVEMGMDIVYFVDLGMVSDTYSSFHLQDLMIGYGIGLRLFTSGIGTIRIDLGFNPYGGKHWHRAKGAGHQSDRMD